MFFTFHSSVSVKSQRDNLYYFKLLSEVVLSMVLEFSKVLEKMSEENSRILKHFNSLFNIYLVSFSIFYFFFY